MMFAMRKFRRIGLTVKSDLAGKEAVLRRITDILQAQHAVIVVDAKRTKGIACVQRLRAMKSQKPAIDLLIVIGGDGTIFRAVRELGDCAVPILGINRGAIGFLAEIDFEDVETILPKLLQGHGSVEQRQLLSVTVLRKGRAVFAGRALNEAVIAQGAIARLLYLKANVRGEALTTYRADGLIVSTPTGSTAYSLSAGGPVVHPRLPALILTPINPHSFTQKPIVLPGTDTVDVEVLQKENRFIDSEVSLTLDGQAYYPLRRFDRVVVATDPHRVKFLRRNQDTFFHTLRTKLKWGDAIDV